MRLVLLGLAASAAACFLPASAGAQSLSASGSSGSFGRSGDFVGRPDGHFDGRFDNRRHRDRRGRRFDDNAVYVSEWYGGEWARYNNRGWESDSYNDWWHDQPWRSYPRWVSTNQDCARRWWSGGGWRC